MWNPIDQRFFSQEDSDEEEEITPYNHEVFHQVPLAGPAEAIMTTGLTLGLRQGGEQGKIQNHANTEIIAEATTDT